ncbi:unnamed protein product, partial [Rotaria sordida]
MGKEEDRMTVVTPDTG